MKNTKKIMMALLPVAAALTLASCSSDDDQISTPQSVNTIPYSVTVSESGTRAAFADGTYTGLVFAAGDKLYINNADGTVYGTLTMQSGSGTSSATFSGELSYSGTAPTAETALTATLLSADNEVVQITNHKAAPQYGGICANLAEAVSKYSYLMGTSTFGAATFALSQGTAFLNISMTLNDGESGNKAVTVKNNYSSIASGTVSGTGNVSFLVPVAAGTMLSNALVWVDGWKPSSTFGNTMTDAIGAKVYNIAKTVDKAAVPTDVNWVDLGIVVDGKKILFADRNVGATNGATKESWYGSYFQWAAITPFTSSVDPTWGTCPYCADTEGTKFTKYMPSDMVSNWVGEGSPDNKLVLDPEDNSVQAQWGKSVDYPTKEEWAALCAAISTENYTSEWKENYQPEGSSAISGLNGYVITWSGTPAEGCGTTLFLPAAGQWNDNGLGHVGENGSYWSSSLSENKLAYSWSLYFRSNIYDNYFRNYEVGRFLGRSLRAVKRVAQ